ncbi:hypothetical protein EhV228 [Emiliania huxleyi virus 86]|uniref:Uncharacterized protein n=1 Tax=Emiliania huxleyi virus 86 (isolate United Kingdom/English Channel/1999) TaxID=654925 RepID=Q4A2Q4_EHV8U|nr:hypothetical protein EhV228 [Emiliania huxleyi virus 86]AHA55857.1 hypothetical protein EhV164_00270 [Emiliania huxleyi virus 164]CAI65652.1 hypothetical protein EhV228 [Emiliania huxleyi virus 86]
MKPNIFFYPVTHGWSKSEWNAAYKKLIKLCKGSSFETLFVCETDQHSDIFMDKFDEGYDQLVNTLGYEPPWPVHVPTCDNVSIQWFEPSNSMSIYMNDPIFSVAYMAYGNKATDIRTDISNYLDEFFGCDVPNDQLLENSIAFLNDNTFSTLSSIVKREVINLGASEDEYQALLAVMCETTISEVLSTDTFPNSYHGVAFLGNRPLTMAFNLHRGIWNIHAAKTANNMITQNKNIVFILGRMHIYCIQKMIDSVYGPEGKVKCETHTSFPCNIM